MEESSSFPQSQEIEKREFPFRLKIGIEVHAAILNEQKAFSMIQSSFNSLTSLGLLGTLPQVNTEAIRFVLKVAKALNAKLPLSINFERKSYFYFDLPRGYQLTQFLRPSGRDGYIFLTSFSKKINISSIALEEDTASYTLKEDGYILSPDRLGAPLIEITTKADFRTVEEVVECVKLIRFFLFCTGASKAEFENGQLRVDLNISLENEYFEQITGRAEVKNLASFSAIENSLDALKNYFLEGIEKQDEEILSDMTFSWSEKESKLIASRKKKALSDYFFVTEGSIPTIKLSSKEIRSITGDYDYERLSGLYDEIQNSKLAKRERDEIISSYDFFWECYSLRQILLNWFSSFFILKIFNSYRNEKSDLDSLLIFLHALVNRISSNSEVLIENIKFNKWKMKECCSYIAKYQVNVEEMVNYYLSLPTVKEEHIVNLCVNTILKEKRTLSKIAEREEKLSSFLMGKVRSTFKDKVEMSDAQTIISKHLKKWIEEHLLEKREEKQEEKEVEIEELDKEESQGGS